jgi:uncharacterized protein (DUF1501 family)
MQRRNFLKNMALATGGQFLLNGVALQTLQAAPKLRQFAKLSANDKVLVIIQMHGGNDGLNAVIPLNQYDMYYNMRPNLAIPESGGRKAIRLDNTLPEDQLIGLHPDMTGMKQLYDEGRLTIIQNVGYENMNGSHFKGRDIWFGGGGYADPITSGWIGRYLEMEYEADGKDFPLDFPNTDMPDPLALEFSNEVSLGFHTDATVPAALSIPDPEGFFNFIEDLTGYNEEFNIDPRGIPPASIVGSLYEQELRWILDIEKGTDKYAERLQKVYRDGKSRTPTPKVTYPQIYPLAAPKGSINNPLSRNLEIVSNLVHGGCKTKVYMIRIGGFDTHVNQVEEYDNTLGGHAALMYHVSSSMKAFQDDLKARGIDDKVLTVTMSEFGRRATSNNSFGSDHGTVAPMFVFGSRINPGVIGKNSDLNKVKSYGGNLSDSKNDIVDYRLVFSTILQDWFEVEETKITTVFPTLSTTRSESLSDLDIYDKVPLFTNAINSIDSFAERRFRLKNVYPNPVTQFADFEFYIDNPAHVEFGLYDLQGRLVKILLNEYRSFGSHQIKSDLSGLQTGTYIYKINAGMLKGAKKLIKV